MNIELLMNSPLARVGFQVCNRIQTKRGSLERFIDNVSRLFERWSTIQEMCEFVAQLLCMTASVAQRRKGKNRYFCCSWLSESPFGCLAWLRLLVLFSIQCISNFHFWLSRLSPFSDVSNRMASPAEGPCSNAHSRKYNLIPCVIFNDDEQTRDPGKPFWASPSQS